jgi:hypothetical protein
LEETLEKVKMTWFLENGRTSAQGEHCGVNVPAKNLGSWKSTCAGNIILFIIALK